MATNLIGANAVRAASNPPANRNLLQRIKFAFARVEERSRIYFELSQMTTRELADLGLSPSEIPDVVRGTYRRS